MSAAAELLRAGAALLAEAGIDGARAEARLLLEAATGMNRTALLTGTVHYVREMERVRYQELLARRAAREPMAYVLGRQEFWSRLFAVGPGVLVPRADTETLIEAAISAFPDPVRPLRLLDVGVGSGCLAITLLAQYPNARAVATDLSTAALACARSNAVALTVADRLLLVRADLVSGVGGPFDLVIANPPYIPTAEIKSLQLEVRQWEPRGALDGGPDGLAAYRRLLPRLGGLLAPGGISIVELGEGQDAAVAALAEDVGLAATPHRDLAGIVRCLELRLAPN